MVRFAQLDASLRFADHPVKLRALHVEAGAQEILELNPVEIGSILGCSCLCCFLWDVFVDRWIIMNGYSVLDVLNRFFLSLEDQATIGLLVVFRGNSLASFAVDVSHDSM